MPTSAFFSLVWIVPLGLAVLAAWRDVRTREVPNWACGVLAVAGAANACLSGGLTGLGWCGAAVAAAFGVGVVLFLAGAWGGGDVKLLAGLAAWAGWPGVLGMAAWMGLLGLPMALVAAARGIREIPYAPAIASGFAIQYVWPAALPTMLGL